jgi:hypothetical protein
MTVGELIKKLQKRDRSNFVYYKDENGYHEITSVEPCIVDRGKSIVLIMNGDGGRYNVNNTERD